VEELLRLGGSREETREDVLQRMVARVIREMDDPQYEYERRLVARQVVERGGGPLGAAYRGLAADIDRGVVPADAILDVAASLFSPANSPDPAAADTDAYVRDRAARNDRIRNEIEEVRVIHRLAARRGLIPGR
jgi:hypothetical protein